MTGFLAVDYSHATVTLDATTPYIATITTQGAEYMIGSVHPVETSEDYSVMLVLGTPEYAASVDPEGSGLTCSVDATPPYTVAVS